MIDKNGYEALRSGVATKATVTLGDLYLSIDKRFEENALGVRFIGPSGHRPGYTWFGINEKEEYPSYNDMKFYRIGIGGICYDIAILFKKVVLG